MMVSPLYRPSMPIRGCSAVKFHEELASGDRVPKLSCLPPLKYRIALMRWLSCEKDALICSIEPCSRARVRQVPPVLPRGGSSRNFSSYAEYRVSWMPARVSAESMQVVKLRIRISELALASRKSDWLVAKPISATG